MEHALETKDFFIIPPAQYERNKIKYLGAIKSKSLKKYFENLKPLSSSEVKNLLKQVYGA